MRRIHLGDHERNVRLHPVVLRVREHDLAGAGERRLGVAPRRGESSAENTMSAEIARRIARAHDHVATLAGIASAPIQCAASAIRLPRRSLRRGDLRELEPRMIGEQPNERLADGACRAEHRDAMAARQGGACAAVMRREASSTILSYASTAARSSLDVDELVGRVRDVDRSRTEHERRSPPAEQRNVRRIRDRRDLEPGNRVKVLRRDVRAILELGASLRPRVDLLA